MNTKSARKSSTPKQRGAVKSSTGLRFKLDHKPVCGQKNIPIDTMLYPSIPHIHGYNTGHEREREGKRVIKQVDKQREVQFSTSLTSNDYFEEEPIFTDILIGHLAENGYGGVEVSILISVVSGSAEPNG